VGYTGGAIADVFEVETVNAWAHRTAERCERRLLELVKRYTPVGEPEPGQPARGVRHLRDTWEGETEVFAADHFRVTILTRSPIAPYVEYPTRPHIIRPRADRAPASVTATRRARGTVEQGNAALRFYAGGRIVYAREVHHPGTQGSFMLTRALHELRAEWRVIAREELARVSARVN
jgi:hypothetical protein